MLRIKKQNVALDLQTIVDIIEPEIIKIKDIEKFLSKDILISFRASVGYIKKEGFNNKFSNGKNNNNENF